MINFKIEIDTSGLPTEPEMMHMIDRMVFELANAAMSKWKRLAQTDLRSTRMPYLQALEGPVQIAPGEYELVLNREGWKKGNHDSFVPFVAEYGYGPIKGTTRVQWMLKGKKHRMMPFTKTTIGRKKIQNVMPAHYTQKSPSWDYPRWTGKAKAEGHFLAKKVVEFIEQELAMRNQ